MEKVCVKVVVSGTDPNKELKVTLSKKSKKEIVISILDDIIEMCVEQTKDDPDDEECQYREAEYGKIRQQWINGDDEKTIPTHPKPKDKIIYNKHEDYLYLDTRNLGPVVIDTVTSYDFHYYVTEEMYDDKDLDIIIYEH